MFYIDDNVKLLRSDLNSIINYILSRNNTIILSKKDNLNFYVSPLGLEPRTQSLKGFCSNQLSYGPSHSATRRNFKLEKYNLGKLHN